MSNSFQALDPVKDTAIVRTISSRKDRVSSSLPAESSDLLELRRGQVEIITTLNLRSS